MGERWRELGKKRVRNKRELIKAERKEGGRERTRTRMGRHERKKKKKTTTERKDIICQRWCLSVLSVKEKTTSEEEKG